MASNRQVTFRTSITGQIEFIEHLQDAREKIEALFALFPKRGGTYFYCTHKSMDKKGHAEIRCTWRGKIHPNGLAKYRRHYRRWHDKTPPL